MHFTPHVSGCHNMQHEVLKDLASGLFQSCFQNVSFPLAVTSTPEKWRCRRKTCGYHIGIR